ncbi:MAG: hypothetical protein ACOYBD_06650 [Bilifractor sp.]|jgi:cytoskeletal protein RodZ
MAGRKRILNDRPLKMIAAILIAVMVILFIRYMASPSGGNRTPESREAVQSASVSPSVGAENAGASAEGNQGTLEAVAADSSASSVTGTEEGSGVNAKSSSAAAGSASSVSAVSSSSSVNASSGNSSAENASSSSASSAGGTDNSAVKGDTAVLSDGNGNTVTVTYDSGVAWYDANQNVYSPLGSGNWMDESGNIYTEEGSSNNSGDMAGGGSGINLVQNRG